MKPAMTYFPAVQYHRRQGLNCCVRDGNRCFPLSMLTGKSVVRLSADNGCCREGWSFRLTELATWAENDLQAHESGLPTGGNPVDKAKTSTVSNA
jgi:hypothetical protein